MRQLRQASSQGYNVLGRSHENLHGSGMSPSPYLANHPAAPGGFRKEPLRRYASAHALPSGGVQFRNPQHPPTAPVLRISGDFEDMWNRHHSNASASAQHKPVFGRGIISVVLLHVTSIISRDECCASKYSPANSTGSAFVNPNENDYTTNLYWMRLLIRILRLPSCLLCRSRGVVCLLCLHCIIVQSFLSLLLVSVHL